MTTHERASKDEQAPAQKQVRLVLADDHQVMRRGIQMLLNAEPDFVVVAEAGNIDSARRYVREHHPNVLLLDLNMPGGPVLEAIPKLRAEAPDTQIVVLTMDEEPAVVRAALRAGALGYVLKEASDTELVQSIRRAAAGEVYLNRRLAGRLIADRVRTSSWD
jgi:two-component system, NarL family, response regulator NreC